MKRYIAQFVRGGFPELYAVLDTHEGWQVSEPKPYHEANDEAEARNNGTFGQANLETAIALIQAAPPPPIGLPPAIVDWLSGTRMTP